MSYQAVRTPVAAPFRQQPDDQNAGPGPLRENTMAYENITVDRRGRVGLITLNRPKALNALNGALIGELNAVLDSFAEEEGIGAVVITGNEKAFAAGADITEMRRMNFVDAYGSDFIAAWNRITTFRKPVIAAVAGYALGGGCELAMMCDIVIAADNARFGQPEIKLGTIPGAGGTQRLTRAVGKSKAMEMILTGRMMNAEEAERSGLASRVVPAADVVDEAVVVAERIAHFSAPTVALAKASVNRAFETTLTEGVLYERAVFYASFATEDQKEGMDAFIEKREPAFNNR